MAAFVMHHLNGSLRHLAADFPQCTVLGERTRRVSQVVVDMVWYLLNTAAPSPAVSRVVESPLNLKPVFLMNINRQRSSYDIRNFLFDT